MEEPKTGISGKGLNNVNIVLRRVENIVGKGGNAGYQHLLLFPQCSQKAFLFFKEPLKVGIVC